MIVLDTLLQEFRRCGMYFMDTLEEGDEASTEKDTEVTHAC